MMKRLPLFGIASVLFGILITVAPAQAELETPPPPPSLLVMQAQVRQAASGGPTVLQA